MFDDGTKNDCEHSVEVVNYLYGEFDARQKVLFERHLAECSLCTDDVKVFGDLRTVFGELRGELNHTVPPIRIEIDGHRNNRGLLASLVELLTGSRTLIGGGVVAALLLTAGVIFMSDGEPTYRNLEIATNSVKTPKAVSSPLEAEATRNLPGSDVAERRGSDAREHAEPAGRASGAATEIRRQQESTNRRKQTRVEGKAPTLSTFEDDEEDNSLRLSDLFGEIGD